MPTFVGAVRNNVRARCAALLCRACGNLTVCVAERYLTLRTGYEKHGRKNPLPYPFSKRSPVSGLRQIRKQGKGRSSKRKENRRLSFLFALRRGRGESPRSAERNSSLNLSEKPPARIGRTRLRQFVCPGQPAQKKEPPVRGEPACGSSCAPLSRCRKGAARIGRTRLRQFVCPRSAGAAKGAARIGRTRLRQFVCPGQPVQQKEPPVRGEPACGSSCAPLSRCRKGAARQGRTRLRQFVCPAQPVQKRSRPSGANPPAAVRVPRSACAEKRKAPQNCFHGAQSMHFYSNRSSVSTSLRAGACGSCAG